MAQLDVRLEDVIEKAKKAQKASADVKLLKRPIKFLVHPEAEIVEEQEAKLYSAEFHFDIDGEKIQINKVYLTEFITESPEDTMVNRNIANARLKKDFERLKAAGIEIKETYFE